ncbi:IS4 family transposase [Bacillus carboniphilus]|uniref:IS4 family transposase n=1 Tax=Bacillus carboniphilus TaxID=86663 RepID=A0ABY9K326_9BACI|nr:IS4 family transposase [Bacillus carboniphilus]WLR44311.1 IS4 family transposase [Bacillus carboniphilus]
MKIHYRLKNKPIIREISRLHVIDSSTMTMSLSQYPWATFRKTKAGIKLHLKVVVTKEMTIPDEVVLSPANHSDLSKMDSLVELDPDCLYLFDRGYMDYKQLDHYCFKDIRFITRLKKNAKIEYLNEQVPDPENLIFQDAEVYLGGEQTGTKMMHTVRLIKTKDREGNEVILITSCFDLTAKEIGDLYRYRWKIETFFKWMKQHLNITSFYGKSPNAVYNQIWIALITYSLEVLLKLSLNDDGSLLTFKRRLETLLYQPFHIFVKALFKEKTRTSKGRRKQNWEVEYRMLEQQVLRGEVDFLDKPTGEPLFVHFS